MIDPTLITNRNRLLKEGKGIIVIYKNDFYVDYPIYEILNTRANEQKFGTITDKVNHVNGLKWERKHLPFNIDAKTFFNELQMFGMFTQEQEEEFYSKSGNVNKMKYIYSLTNLRMIL